MKKIFLLLTISLLSFIPIDAQNDEKAIQDCFTVFKKSFAEKDGKGVYTCIDKKSKDYFDALLAEIKYADSLAVSRLDPIDKLFLFCIRSLMDTAILKRINSVELFDYLIKNDLFGSFDYIEIAEITIYSNLAQAKISGTNPPSFLIFNKEDNGWKYYINSIFEPEKEKLKMILANNKMDETEFVKKRVEKMTNKAFDIHLWIAPLKK